MEQYSAKIKPSFRSNITQPKYYRIFIVVLIFIFIALSGLYLRFAWNNYQKSYASEALSLAQSLGTILSKEQITQLINQKEKPDELCDDSVKEKLIRLVETNGLIYYAYLLGEQNGEVLVLADSNTAADATYTPLGDWKRETTDSDWVPFKSDYSLLTKPIYNEWGSWVRTLVPIKDSENKVIAILGLSFSSIDWNDNIWDEMVPDIIITASLMMLLLALLWIWTKYLELQKRNSHLAFDEKLYRSLFEQAPIGITLNTYNTMTSQYEIVAANPMARKIFDIDDKNMSETKWTDLTYPEDLKAELELFKPFTEGKTKGYSIEKRFLQTNGHNIWMAIKTAAFLDENKSNFPYLCLMEDISERKATEEALKESERSKAVLLAHLPGMAYRTLYDREWTVEFASKGCLELTGYEPENLLHNRDLSYNDIISPEYRDIVWSKWTKVLTQKTNFRYEYEIITKNGERKWVLELGQGIYEEDGAVEAIEGIVLDISEQKKREAHMAYLNQHDFLTGLYNRNYLEEVKQGLNHEKFYPLSIAICDINGLRLINDAYSYLEGDSLIIKVANLLKNCCRPTDILGRVNGGEFCIFMPNTSEKEANQLMETIQATIKSYNRATKLPLYEISITTGFGTVVSEECNIEEAIKTARNYMNHRKILNQNSLYHSILASIMATLYAKSEETEEHGQRLGNFATMIGKNLGLSQKDLDDLHLLSMLHDIGKIGVEDSILNKPGKLTAEEWVQMKKHPEIGHRIVMSTPELAHIAEYILCHHERWDGKGYPSGLEGNEIPLLSRIISVADAYDAMTEDRVYRKALPAREAIDEIKKGAGTQFDPEIANLFIHLLKNKLNNRGEDIQTIL